MRPWEKLTPANRDREIVERWKDRPRAQRTQHDVLAFYGWLTDHESRLVPPGPGAYERIRQLVSPHIVEESKK